MMIGTGKGKRRIEAIRKATEVVISISPDLTTIGKKSVMATSTVKAMIARRYCVISCRERSENRTIRAVAVARPRMYN